jgi:hypothetical protein
MIIIIKTIAIIAVIITGVMATIINNWWTLPEMQRDRCLAAIHSQYASEIIRAYGLQVPGKVKIELMTFAQEREVKRAKDICGVDISDYQKVSVMQK